MKTKGRFSERKRMMRDFWRLQGAIDAGLTKIVGALDLHPRKHSLAWFVAIAFFTNCPVCFFFRAFTLGALFGVAVGLML